MKATLSIARVRTRLAMATRIFPALLGAGFAASIASPAHADTLANLIGAAAVASNGLVYSGFTDGGTLPASSIAVTFTATGLQFSANWNTLTPGSDSSEIGRASCRERV